MHHPPDFDDGELEEGPHRGQPHHTHRSGGGGVGGGAGGSGSGAGGAENGVGAAEFGVSLLIPTGGANETTLLGGAVVPSMQMVELRCSVANVTQRTFTI